MRSYVAIALIVFVLAGCAGGFGGITRDDRASITVYLENAANYYDAGHYKRAWHQWQQALDLDPTLDRAELGQAMVLYQMGQETSPAGLERLGLAEQRLDDLRERLPTDYRWRAELGYALVQTRWAELYDRKLRLLEADELEPGEEAEHSEVQQEMRQRAALGIRSYRNVLAGEEREPRDRLTCTLGLARLHAIRGDLTESLQYAREYESEVVASKDLWRESMDRYPSRRQEYEFLLQQAETHESRLRDVVANVLFKLGRYDEAEAELSRAIELEPGHADAYLNRGIIRQLQRDWDNARSDFTDFLALTELADDAPSVREASDRLAQVESELAAEDADVERRLLR